MTRFPSKPLPSTGEDHGFPGMQEEAAPMVVAVGPATPADIAMEEARRAGLLEGERSEHMSFRAPKALVEAAMRESGLSSKTELGIAALALLAQSDPFRTFFREYRGKLGRDFDFEY